MAPQPRPASQVIRRLMEVEKARAFLHTKRILPTPRADIVGSIGELLAASSLFPNQDSVAALNTARDLRHTSIAGAGPAFGSLPLSATGRRNPLAVDLAAPWDNLLALAPALAPFAQRRQQQRANWDRDQHIAHGTPLGDPQLARLQIKARFSSFAPDPRDYDAVRFHYVGTTVPANDVFLLLLFAAVDENDAALAHRNLLWRAVAVADEALHRLDTGTTHGRLDWLTIDGWYPSAFPPDTADLTARLRAVRLP